MSEKRVDSRQVRVERKAGARKWKWRFARRSNCGAAVPKWDGGGVYPLCFLKCVEVFENGAVKSGREMSMWKRMKMLGLLGRRFERARAFGRGEAGREEDRGDRGVGTGGLHRSLPER
jgi:hypothetical protein